MPAVRIRTDRLWLRPFDEGDVDRLQVVFNLPDVRRYLLDDTLVPRFCLGCREVRRSVGEIHEQIHLELSEAAFSPRGEVYEVAPAEG